MTQRKPQAPEAQQPRAARDLQRKVQRIMLHILDSKSPTCVRARNEIFGEGMDFEPEDGQEH